MKRRLLGALTAGTLLVGLVAVPSFAAQGGLERYQPVATTYTILVQGTYTHTFTVTVSPCDGSLAITGTTPQGSGYHTTETVTGTLADDVITFTSIYDGPYNPGYTWSGSFPVAGGPLTGALTGTVTAGAPVSAAYRNHGEYVASMGGGADAAHSCIGMPKVSVSADAADATTADAAAAKAGVTAVRARLLATLQAVVARLQADGQAHSNAIDAIQKHVQALANATSGLDRAAAGAGNASEAKPDKPSKPTQATTPTKPEKPAKPEKPDKPTPPAQAKGHANGEDHPSKP